MSPSLPLASFAILAFAGCGGAELQGNWNVMLDDGNWCQGAMALEPGNQAEQYSVSFACGSLVGEGNASYANPALTFDVKERGSDPVTFSATMQEGRFDGSATGAGSVYTEKFGSKRFHAER